MAYCVRADLRAFLPSGGLPNPARAGTGSASGDYIEIDQHGLEDDDAVTFRAEADGASVPSPLVEGTTYYAKVVDGARFQVAATQGGAAIDLTDAGESFVVCWEHPWGRWMDAAARDVDSFFPDDVVPLVDPVPAIAVSANAELAAARGLAATGGASIPYGERLDQISARIARWVKMNPVRGTPRQTSHSPNLAITATATPDPRGWAGRCPERIP